MIFRRATPSDYSGIVDLAAANHRDSLTLDEQRQGFLSARFSLGQVAAMAEDLGIVVAVAEERVAGFMCASRLRMARPARHRQAYGGLRSAMALARQTP